MPRPEVKEVTFTIDGREVTAPENIMLVDGAKYGDVEIPVFCYEPKLGAPVGACRMCLVEVEGIPKLQTACSTPVKDGMVVHTQTDRVQSAQRAVVEFLLINHPLDCPVCDKGGECPLQDITFGWGAGTSRFIEPKRHFKKPLELSPLIAIDRERCILCYRCVRFSQEISEDYQLILLQRGAASFVGTFDGRPYVAPFSGNITELCPVGALTSSTYRFRARPWDIEGAGTVCTLCPSQCNVELTVRDDKVLRVLARDNDEVDDGWLCDKGRYAFQHAHVDERITQPLVREGVALLPASWEKAYAAAAGALKKAGARAAAIAGGETTNEEAFLLQRLFREGLGSDNLSTGGAGLPAALLDPALQATVPDLEFADTVLLLDCDPLDDAPILDLRIRKGIRRRGVKLAVASAHPTALDPSAQAVVRFAPGGGEGFLVSLDAVLSGDEGNIGGGASAAGTKAGDVRALRDLLSGDVVIVYGERLLGSEQAAQALLNIASRLGLRGQDGSGLLCLPDTTNGRGIAEAGFAGGDFPEDPAAVYLLHVDPLRQFGDRERWEKILGAPATTVIAHESVLTPTIEAFADVVFPAEAYPEKEGTIVHPDGRVQRLRPAIGRSGDVRATWQVIAEVAGRTGLDLGVRAGAMASQQLFDAVPRYRGLTLDKLAGRGLRPEGEPGEEWTPQTLSVPAAAPAASGDTLRLGTFRTLWASKEVDVSPALAFARPDPVVELSPADAERIGVGHGDQVELGSNGTRLRGRTVVRAAIPAGTVFVPEGVGDVTLAEKLVEVRALTAVGAVDASAAEEVPTDANMGKPTEASFGQEHAGADDDTHAAESSPKKDTGGGGGGEGDSGPEKATGGAA
jgi:NADH-quinone oxidoreductase subunit G